MVAHAATPDTTTLLDYAVLAYPHPLRAGHANTSLDIVISNPYDRYVHCHQIAIVLPENLTTISSISYEVTYRKTRAPSRYDEHMQPWLHSSGATVLVQRTAPVLPSNVVPLQLGPKSATVHITGLAIDPHPGRSSITIIESADFDPHGTPRRRQRTIALTKHPTTPRDPYTIILHTTDGEGRPGTTRVNTDNGPAGVHLAWPGSTSATYALHRGDTRQLQDLPTGTIRATIDNLTRDTTVTLLEKHDNSHYTFLSSLTVTVTRLRHPALAITGNLDTHTLAIPTAHVTTDLTTPTMTSPTGTAHTAHILTVNKNPRIHEPKIEPPAKRSIKLTVVNNSPTAWLDSECESLEELNDQRLLPREGKATGTKEDIGRDISGKARFYFYKDDSRVGKEFAEIEWNVGKSGNKLRVHSIGDNRVEVSTDGKNWHKLSERTIDLPLPTGLEIAINLYVRMGVLKRIIKVEELWVLGQEEVSGDDTFGWVYINGKRLWELKTGDGYLVNKKYRYQLTGIETYDIESNPQGEFYITYHLSDYDSPDPNDTIMARENRPFKLENIEGYHSSTVPAEKNEVTLGEAAISVAYRITNFYV